MLDFLSFIPEFFLQSDKQKHILATLMIFLFDASIRYFCIQKRRGGFVALSFALRDTLLIGITKEIIDALGFGTPDIMDMFANILGMIFPLYLYISYREIEKIGESRIITNTSKFWHHIIKSTQNFSKEGSEGLYFVFKNWITRIQQKPQTSQTLTLKMQAKKEWSESEQAWKRMKKVYRYSGLFFLSSILDFFIQIVRMPFFIFIRGSRFVYSLFRSMLSRIFSLK